MAFLEYLNFNLPKSIFSQLYFHFQLTLQNVSQNFDYPYNTNAIEYVSKEFLDKHYSFHQFVWHFRSIFCIMKKILL